MRSTLIATLLALTASGLVVGEAAAAPVAPTAEAQLSTLTPVPPVRVLDTRAAGGKVGPGATITLDLANRTPATATAVVLNLTGTEPTQSTFVTAYPTGAARPTASNLNLVPGETRPNQVTVALGADRKVSLFNNAGSVHLVADFAGYYASGAGAKFTSIAPKRMLDTRHWSSTNYLPVGPGGVRAVDLAQLVPPSATAVTFTLTGTEPTAPTFITAWPSGLPRTALSNLNLAPRETRANLVTVSLGADRKVNLFNNAGETHLIADVVGFYTPEFGTKFRPRTPERLLDTRGENPVGPGGERAFGLQPIGYHHVGMLLNLTGVDATASTYVTAWSSGYSVRPSTSNLNVEPGITVPSAAVVQLGPDTRLDIYNNAGSVHVIADLAGEFIYDEPVCSSDCVWAWGHNDLGALGFGHRDRSSVPAPVALSGVKAVTGAMYTGGYALMLDGTVRSWGKNSWGRLGAGWVGGFTPYPVPVRGLDSVVQLVAGTHTVYALKSDGTVWAWGSAAGGAIPGAAAEDVPVPIKIAGLSGVDSLGAGTFNAFAVKAGVVYGWGDNQNGGTGTGSPDITVRAPTALPGLTEVVEVTAGLDTGYARRADGTVWAWGRGPTGNGCSPSCGSPVPVRVADLTEVVGIGTDGIHGFAVRADGSAWAWGTTRGGELGNGDNCQSNCVSLGPTQVVGVTDAVAIDGHGQGGFVLRSDGSVWGWGNNTHGQLNPPGPPQAVPGPVSGVSGAAMLSGGWNAGRVVVPGPRIP